MGKTSRLFKGELKKIFLGPGIFFMTALLILLLTIAPKLFTPTTKTDLTTGVSISTTNVESAYSSFLEYKRENENKLTQISADIDKLTANNADFKKKLVDLTNEIYTCRMELDGLIYTGSESDLSSCLVKFIENVNEFKTTYADFMNNYAVSVILASEQLDYDINQEADQLTKILNADGDKSNKDFYIKINDKLENYKCVSNLCQLVKQVKNLSYSTDNLKEIKDKYLNVKADYKNELLTAITTSANTASTDEEYNISKTNIEELKSNALSYLTIQASSYSAIEKSLLLEISNNISDSEMSTYKGFENFNSYKYKETVTRCNYLIDNQLSDSNIANVFSFNVNCYKDTNAFDYMYFTLEIVSFLIIAFTVILGAGMIAKEYSEGTIKLLAIRPYKRSKIIMSKILATMFLALIFVLVSTVITFITGYILYGVSFPSVLIVLNGSTAFTLPIIVEFLIYLVCLLIKIWIFALIAIAISTIFKSYIVAVCISAGIYILNLLVTFLAKGSSWLKYNVFANLDLFKFFGGGNINAPTTFNENLTNLFATNVFPDTSIWLTIICVSVMALILNILIFSIFKHRDIT